MVSKTLSLKALRSKIPEIGAWICHEFRNDRRFPYIDHFDESFNPESQYKSTIAKKSQSRERHKVSQRCGTEIEKFLDMLSAVMLRPYRDG